MRRTFGPPAPPAGRRTAVPGTTGSSARVTRVVARRGKRVVGRSRGAGVVVHRYRLPGRTFAIRLPVALRHRTQTLHATTSRRFRRR